MFDALTTPSPFRRFRNHFEQNARRPLPRPAPDQRPFLPPHFVEPLRHCLSRFQLGETGEGRIVAQVRASTLAGIDDDYRTCVALFIAEEGRHARILGDLVRSLGARTQERSFSAQQFARLRNLAGIELKLLVLMGAEIVGQGAYEVLADHLPPCAIERALRELVDDEREHLRFHVEFFSRRLHGPLGHAGFALQFWAAMCGASALVVADHGPAFRRMGIPAHRLVAHILTLAARTHLELRSNARTRSQELRENGATS